MPTNKPSTLFQTLSDPTRLAIFEHLSRGETTVTALTECFPVSQPAISQHLAVLRRSGLASHRRDGRRMLYQARPEGLAPLTDWLAHYRTFWPERINRLKNLLDKKSKGDKL
jgi:DNA-binding transcriptional ArsR family regulator